MIIKENVSMKTYNSFKIGGSSRFFGEAYYKSDIEQALEFCNKHNIPYYIIGGGTNILISDKGYDGFILKIIYDKLYIDKDKTVINIGAGAELNNVIQNLINKGIGGMEDMAGIPGTVGGAVVGNAGAYGTEMKDVLISLRCIDKNNIYTIDNSECGFRYRYSDFKNDRSKIVFDVKLKLKHTNKYYLLKRSNEIIKLREKKQPIEYPNAGSFFKNPIIKNEFVPDIDDMPKWKIDENHTKLSSAWLIEKCGLKGFRINNAGVSEKHSLFLVNYGDAAFDDVIKVMDTVIDKVMDRFGIKLEPETEIINSIS